MAKSQSSQSQSSTSDNLRQLIADAEKALSAAGDSASDEVRALRERLRDALDDGRAFAGHMSAFAREQAARADEFVHERPYVAIGIAAGIGAMLGVLLTRRCHD